MRIKVRNSFIFAACFMAVLAGLSCSRQEESGQYPIKVDVDIADAMEITIDPSKLLRLETSDSSVLYEIGKMAVYDDKVVTQSRSLMRVFDRESGKFLYNIGKIGQGPGEYLGVGCFWNEGDTIRIVSSGAIMSFLSDGTPLGKTIDFKTVDAPFFLGATYATPAPDGSGYYVIDAYTGGSAEHNPQYSFFSSDGKFIGHVPGRELSDGSFTPDRMQTDAPHGRVLAWEQLRDTLFTVDMDGVHPLYVFDFGKNKFPVEFQAQPDFFDRVQSYINHKTGGPYASFLKYYQSKDDALFFSFITSEQKVYLGRYNEKNGDVDTYRLEDPEDRYKLQVAFKIVDDQLVIVIVDSENPDDNPLLYFLPISEL